MKRTLPSHDDIPSTGKRNRFSIDELLEEKERQISTTSSLKDEGKEESDDDISPLLLTSLNQSYHHSIDAECRLEGKELWAKFYDLGTEMIITKSGRLVDSFLLSFIHYSSIH